MGQIEFSPSGTSQIVTRVNQPLAFGVNNSQKMTIETSGAIKSTGGMYFTGNALSGNDTGINASADGGDLRFMTNGTNRVSIASNGNATFNHSVHFSNTINTTGTSFNSTGENYIFNSEYAMYFNVDSTGGTSERFIFGVGRTGTSGGTEWLQIDNSGTAINTQLNINNDAFTFGDGKAKIYNFTFESDSGFTSATEYMRIENTTGNWVWCLVEVTVISGFGSSSHYGKKKREYFVRILGDNNNGNGVTVTTTTIGTDSGASEGVITLTTVGNEVTDSLLFKVQTAGGRRTSVFTKVYASNNQYLTITGQ